MTITSVASLSPEAAVYSESFDTVPEGLFLSETEGRRKQLVFEADEIVFKAGNATVILRAADGGIVEIRAANVRLTGDDVHSNAAGTNTVTGRQIVSESLGVTELLGKLVRIDGQCVKIS